MIEFHEVPKYTWLRLHALGSGFAGFSNLLHFVLHSNLPDLKDMHSVLTHAYFFYPNLKNV
jgi:hypothetical protein